MDKFNNIYVADTSNNRVQVLDSDGNFDFTLKSTFSQPTGVAVSSTGVIAVAGNNDNKVKIFDSLGNLVKTIGSTAGSNPGQFNNPRGVAINSTGHIYVADADNFRIQVFDPSGVFLESFGSRGAGNNQFESANRITIDDADNIYVTDDSNDRVQVFENSTNNFLFSIGSLGSADGKFDTPAGIAVDSFGTIYVADNINDRVQVFDQIGSLFELSSIAGTTADLVVTKQVNDATLIGGTITDGSTFNYTITVTNFGPDAAQDVNMTDILPPGVTLRNVIDPRCFSFFVDSTCILGDLPVGSTEIEIKVAVDQGFEGVLVNDVEVTSLSFDPAPDDAIFDFKFGSFSSPSGVAVNSTGHILVSDGGTSDRIHVFDPSGVLVGTIGSSGTAPGLFNNPE